MLPFLYSTVALLVAGLAFFLKRPVGWKAFALFFFLPILFLLPGFVSEKTPLPVDHAMMVPPWSTLGYRPTRNPYLNDVALQFAPWAKGVRMAWKEGSLPWRNRWNGCGTPLAANVQSAAFSPFTFLMFALPLARAFTLAAALKLFLALTGMWLWLRELKISESSALVGAVVFSFSFAMVPPWLFFPHASVICLWPWALFAIELLRDPRSAARASWVLVGIFAAWSLCGHLESAALGATFIGLWLLARWLAGGLPEPGPVFRRIALAALAAVALAAFALVPQVFAIVASNRAVNAARPFWADYLSWLPHRPAFGNGVFTTLFPRTLGDGITSPMITGTGLSFPEMALGYIGIVGWACALLILRPGCRRQVAEWTLLLPMVAGFGAAVALWPFGEIVSLVPGLKMIHPPRFLNLIPPAGAAIAAFELDRFRQDFARKRRAALYPVFAGAGLALFAVATFWKFRSFHLSSGGLPSQKNALLLTLASLAGFAGLAALLALSRSYSLASAFAPLVALLVAAELFRQGGRLFEFASPAYLFPETPLIRFLQAQKRPFRVLGEGPALFPSSNVFAGMEEIRTHDAVERRDYVEFLDAACGYNPREYFKKPQDINAPALDFLNVKYLVSTPGRESPGPKWKQIYSARDGTVFENVNALPRIFAPRRVELLAKRLKSPFLRNAMDSFGEDFRASIRGRSWNEKATLLIGSENASALSPDADNGRLKVSSYRESTNSVSFRASVVSAKVPVVAVASLVQDGGWSAKDEKGRTIPVGWANGPFLALLLPPGEHLVRLEYRPPSFRTGAGISVLTVMGVAILGVIRRKRILGRELALS